MSYKPNEKLYKYLNYIMNLREDNDNNENIFLDTMMKSSIALKLKKKFRKFINKYIYMILLKKAGYIEKRYIKLMKQKKGEINLCKERYIRNDIIQEDFTDKLYFINIGIGQIKVKNKSNEKLIEITVKQQNQATKITKFDQNLSKSPPTKGSHNAISESKKLLIELKSQMHEEIINVSKIEENKDLGKNILPTMQKSTRGKTVQRKTESKGSKKGSMYQNLILKLDNFSYYKGEMDLYNNQFNNLGILIKPSRSYYNGTFRNGKKDGYGYIYKFDYPHEEYSFYFGEWQAGKPHGFGLSFSVPKLKDSKKTICRGKFKNGTLVSGYYTNIVELEKKILVEQYQGKFKDKTYKSGEKFVKISYKKDEYDSKKLDVESYYFYRGGFKNNIENGKGLSIKSFPLMNYRYYYKGDFDNGLMHGEGVILFEGNFFVKKYEGMFEKDKWFCKYGRLYFRTGDVFEGFFDYSNSKSLLGCYIHNEDHEKNYNYNKNEHLNFNKHLEFTENNFDLMNDEYSHVNSGDVFFGQFNNDKKHGFGKYLFKQQGLIIIGNYIDGERNGKFETVKKLVLEFKEEDVENSEKLYVNNNNTQNKQNYITATEIKEKIYYLFESDEVIDTSDKPFKE